MPSFPKAFARDNSVVLIGHILIGLKGLFLLPILVKSVGVPLYGGYVLFSSIMGIAFGISSFGTGYRARRFLPAASNVSERAQLFYPQFFFNLISIAVISALIVCFSGPANKLFFKGAVSYSLGLIPAHLFAYLLYAQAADYFRYTGRVHYMILVTLIFPYLDIGLILLFLFLGISLTLNVLILIQAFSALIIAFVSFIVILRELGLRVHFYTLNKWLDDIRLGFPLILNNIVDFILAAGDRYVIACYLSLAAVGFYNPGYLLGSTVLFISKAMSTALPQLLSRAVDDGNEVEAERMLNYALKIFLITGIPFCAGGIVLGRPVLSLFASTQVADQAAAVLSWVSFGSLFFGVSMILSNALFVRMKTAAMFKINAGTSLFNLLANILLLYFFRHITFAALVTFISYFFSFVCVFRSVRRVWKFDLNIPLILKATAASTVMVVAISWVWPHLKGGHAIAFLTALGISCVVYFLTLFLTGAVSKKEISFLKECTLSLSR